jgi:hypothetical protein
MTINVDRFLGCHLFLLVFVLPIVLVSLHSNTFLNLNHDQGNSYCDESTSVYLYCFHIQFQIYYDLKVYVIFVTGIQISI